MLEEFKNRLGEARTTEEKQSTEFTALRSSKQEEIKSAEEQRLQKMAESADNAKRLADAKEDLEQARTQLDDDRKFLRNLTLHCQNIDHEWAQRTKTRSEEIGAVSEALQILAEDDSR